MDIVLWILVVCIFALLAFMSIALYYEKHIRKTDAEWAQDKLAEERKRKLIEKDPADYYRHYYWWW